MGTDWISTLLAKLGELWPFTRLAPWERGILVLTLPAYRDWLGRIVPTHTITKPVGPGVHFTFWYYAKVYKLNTRPQVMDLQVQSITLKDRTNVSFSVNLEYEITDPELTQTAVQHLGSSLEATARNHLARRIRGFEFPELLAKQDDLERSLRGTLTTRAKKWGVEVNDVGFTDMTESTTTRLLGDAVLHVNSDVTTFAGKRGEDEE